MKKSNILQLLETHVDKIVLGVLSLASLAVLILYVIGSPYGLEVGGKKRGPGEIDTYVKGKAEQLLIELDQSADPMPYDKTYLADFEKLVQSPVSQVASLTIPSPIKGQAGGSEGPRLYVLPEIAPLTEVAVMNLRGASLVPTDEVAPETAMMLSTSGELQDVDLVTVSANFNVQSLYNNFQQSFYSPRLKPAWRDATRSKPVFARIELQRREQAENGTWSEWTAVPRTRIDQYKKLLEELPLSMEQLQYDVSVWIQQYADRAVQRDILQPDAYTFNISRTEWMPPKYLREALDLIQKKEDAALRQQREERAKRLEEASNAATQGRRPEGGRTTQPRPERRQPEARRGRENPNMEMMPEMAPIQRAPVRKERTVEDVKADVQKIKLTDKADPQSMKESLLVWAHDDTALPGRTYQYRLRLGVFNPIAGKDWYREDQAQFKNQTVLWSGFSDPTEQIYVPKRVHVFPMELIAAKDASQVDKVKVDVAKFNLGQWRMQTFEVYAGEVIGHKAEAKVEQNKPQMGGEMGFEMGFIPEMANPTGQPQVIDFTTSFTLVDIDRVITWGSAQQRKTYDIILYHDPYLRMCQAAIGRSNWSGDLRKEYQAVQEEMNRAVQQYMPGGMEGGGLIDPLFEGGGL